MAAEDFAKSLARVLVYEGGKVDDPADPGGRTNQGVTQATYSAWRRSQGLSPRDVYALEDAERDAIYRKSYWGLVRGDDLPVGVDLVVFDAAVNSGVGQAVKWLQAALGEHYAGQRDGVIGEKTLQAVADFGDPADLIEEICARRLATLKRLRTWSRFGRGWAARIANVQKTALSWADSAPEVEAADVSQLMGHMKAPVNDNLKEPPVSQLATHVTTAATTASAAIAQASTGLQGATVFSWVPYVLGGLAIASVIAGIAIKIASDARDAADKGEAKATVDLDADAGVPTKAEPVIAQSKAA